MDNGVSNRTSVAIAGERWQLHYQRHYQLYTDKGRSRDTEPRESVECPNYCLND